MRFSGLKSIIASRCAVSLAALVLLIPSVQAGPDPGFTVVGWVKAKLSPEEHARSANRAQRLRPVAVDLNQAPPPPSQPEVMAVRRQPPAAAPSAYPAAPSIPPPPIPPQTFGPSSPQAVVQSRPPQPVQSAPPPPRRETTQRRAQVGNSRPPERKPSSSRSRSRSSSLTGEPTVEELRRRAEYLADKGLRYKFGGDHPSEGGLDCSGTMQFLLKSMGYPDIPRTSYQQYEWLKNKGTLRKVSFWHSKNRAINNFRPGDLIFWGGTYNSGHKVSHVMIYLGRSRSGKHYIFGARGKRSKGLNGSGVDVFEYRPESTGGRLVGYGRLPGLRG